MTLLRDNGPLATKRIRDPGHFAPTPPQASTAFMDYCADLAAAAIVGKTAPTFTGSPPYAWHQYMNIYANGDTATRNTHLWCGNSAALTAIPRNLGSRQGGILVSPRDMIFAAHYGVPGQILFTGYPSGAISITPNPAKMTNVLGPGISNVLENGSWDILVVTLDADVPAALTPALVLPGNIMDYMAASLSDLVTFQTNQDDVILASNAFGLGGIDGIFCDAAAAPLGVWAYPVRGGDSGSPNFILIDGQLVVLGCTHQAAFLSNIGAHKHEIEAAMSANGSPYGLTVVDLGDFA